MSRCRFKLRDFPTNYISNCSYARGFLTIKIFSVTQKPLLPAAEKCAVICRA